MAHSWQKHTVMPQPYSATCHMLLATNVDLFGGVCMKVYTCMCVYMHAVCSASNRLPACHPLTHLTKWSIWVFEWNFSSIWVIVIVFESTLCSLCSNVCMWLCCTGNWQSRQMFSSCISGFLCVCVCVCKYNWNVIKSNAAISQVACNQIASVEKASKVTAIDDGCSCIQME